MSGANSFFEKHHGIEHLWGLQNKGFGLSGMQDQQTHTKKPTTLFDMYISWDKWTKFDSCT